MLNTKFTKDLFKNTDKSVFLRNKTQIVSAPCGSGKTYQICLEMRQNRDLKNQLYIATSIQLANETLAMFENHGCSTVDIIHSDTHPANVKRAIIEYMNDCDHYGHILIITWSAYNDLPYFHHRDSWDVYIDEVPQLDRLHKFTIPYSRNHIADYVEVVDTVGENLGLVVAKDPFKLKTHLEKPLDDAHQLFRPLLLDVLSDNRDVFVDLNAWTRVIENAQVDRENEERNRVYFLSMLNAALFRNVALIGAHIEQSMLCHWLTSKYNVRFVKYETIMDRLRFTQHGKDQGKRLKISYMFKEAAFSKTIRDKNHSLTDRPMVDEIEDLVEEHFQTNEYLLVTNNDYQGRLLASPHATRIPVISHGVNSHDHMTRLAFLTALNREPKHLVMLRQLGISREQIQISTGLEVLYQDVMRTNLRDPSSNKAIDIFVPSKSDADFLMNIFPGSTSKRIGNLATKKKSPLTDSEHKDRANFRSRKVDIHKAAKAAAKTPESIIVLKSNPVSFEAPKNRQRPLTCSVTFQTTMKARLPEYFFVDIFEKPLGFVKLLKSAARTVLDSKEDGQLFIPAVFDPTIDPEGYRRQTNFIGSSMMVLDFDGGDLSPDQFIRIFWEDAGPSNKRSFVICNSWSRSKDEPNRYRVFLFYKCHALSISEHRAIYDSICDRLAENGHTEESAKLDRTCRSGVQCFYLPCKNRWNPEGSLFKKFGLKDMREVQRYGIDPSKYALPDKNNYA